MADLAQEHIEDYKESDDFVRDIILYLQELQGEYHQYKQPHKFNALGEVIEILMFRS